MRMSAAYRLAGKSWDAWRSPRRNSTPERTELASAAASWPHAAHFRVGGEQLEGVVDTDTPMCNSKARSPVKMVTSSARGPVSRSDAKNAHVRTWPHSVQSPLIARDQPQVSTRRLTSARLVASSRSRDELHRLESEGAILKSRHWLTAPSSLEGPRRPWSAPSRHLAIASSIPLSVRPARRAALIESNGVDLLPNAAADLSVYL